MKRGLRLLGAAVALMLIVAACGDDSGGGSSASGDGGGESVELSLVAYSTPQAAYEQLIEAFQATPEGENVTFTTSFGPSGDQSRAVEAGQDADIVAFSLEGDVTRLVDAGLVDADWADDQYDGMVTDSVVSLAVREGNPEGMDDWDDLVAGDVEVITPNPFTSGGARWNIMAAYGQVVQNGGTHDEGVEYLQDLFDNVPVQDGSARDALGTFVGGAGDVLLAYENEAIFAQQEDQPIDYVVPDSTILIENPIAVTSGTEHPEEAQAFLDFVRSEAGQTIFAENGYRPVIDGVDSPYDFPEPSGLFTIADLGGWPDVSAEFFDPEGSVMATIESDLGVALE
jgi:sulfate/thiosulfate transport system substrate-binding protein